VTREYVQYIPSRKSHNGGPNRRNKGKRTGSVPSSRLPFSRLGAIVQSRIFPITCAEVGNFAWIPNVGFGGSGVYFGTLAVTQAGPIYSLNNGAWQTGIVWQNYASLATVFQEYRIMKFSVDWYYSSNSAPNNSTAALTALPIVYWCVDREDALGFTTASSVLQFSDCKIQQAGSTSGTDGRQSITIDRPTVFVAVDNDATLVGTIASSMLERSPWMSCGTNSSGSTAAVIPHGYIKFFIDNCNNTSNTTIGTFTFIFRAYYEYRGID
jgi:hypothetical protein